MSLLRNLVARDRESNCRHYFNAHRGRVRREHVRLERVVERSRLSRRLPQMGRKDRRRPTMAIVVLAGLKVHRVARSLRASTLIPAARRDDWPDHPPGKESTVSIELTATEYVFQGHGITATYYPTSDLSGWRMFFILLASSRAAILAASTVGKPPSRLRTASSEPRIS